MSKNASFPRSERLVHTKEYRHVFKKGKKFHDSGISLYCFKLENNDLGKLGVIISRKAVRKATQRNRMKRVVREFFRKRKANRIQGNQIIVRVEEGCKSFKNKELQQIVEKLFFRAGILAKTN
ncbi:MAG: ribonuclease P protein component [Omnitrophica bacterium RIFCSPLOWO2_12_FULL_44_17]|uniref:Ribonuclease P protein component n=1 Tax=Candidatus Danuiimicrobium aquiferis TaxID=1801832 RepID=A0A1G1L1E2_9BACT|nr:MAG: ribonuclease P protein component [Omnitrophica bacterium RIFCSPHIGHO2_02_FULL_45_28]OGW89998.1 MAG: ribonuclease P protein component [Omnitrophica bacterium RIFCSPHIGHO2_12_FULL_44_12]OGW98962.1 MAG: ribonuclease P protein component [Omnitrophica bacterium RIFCSPLOWO2_12_FULL_44_17]OGX01586.1 MAG: ribonuclease P protein component [Omnitrophica bacterium RIFCSPLOWO2_02_FULL_44_11]